jgi:hypothetical protein
MEHPVERKGGQLIERPRDRAQFYERLYASGVGIILIKSEDPINCLTMAITKQEYSGIGFYCPTKLYGNIKILVYIKDYSGEYDNNWKEGIDLDTLIENPLITRIGYRTINSKYPGRDKLDSLLRISIIDTLNKVRYNNNYSMEQKEQIFELFGYSNNTAKDNKARDIISGLDLINQVFENIGYSNKIKPNNSLDQNVLHETSSFLTIRPISIAAKSSSIISYDSNNNASITVGNKTKQQSTQVNNTNRNSNKNSNNDVNRDINKDGNNKISLICHLGALFLQQDPGMIYDGYKHKLIQAYIVQNDLFEPIIELDLSYKNYTIDLTMIENAKVMSLRKQQPRIEALFKHTFQEVLDNPYFFNTLITGLQQGKYFKQQSQDQYITLLKEFSEVICTFNCSFFEGVKRKKIYLHTLFDNFIAINNLLLKSSNILKYNYPIIDLQDINMTESRKIKLTNVADKDDKKDDWKRNDRSIEYLTNDVGKLHNVVCKMLNNVQNNETVKIDINYLVDIVNNLSRGTNQRYPKISKLRSNQIHNAYIVVDDLNNFEYPICFSDGTKIILPAKNANIDNLSRSQLKELSHILNDICKDDKLRYIYDELRETVRRRRANS